MKKRKLAPGVSQIASFADGLEPKARRAVLKIVANMQRDWKEDPKLYEQRRKMHRIKKMFYVLERQPSNMAVAQAVVERLDQHKKRQTKQATGANAGKRAKSLANVKAAALLFLGKRGSKPISRRELAIKLYERLGFKDDRYTRELLEELNLP